MTPISLRAASPYPIKGFSLVELVIVIVILGVLAFTAVARMGDRTAYQERGYFDELLQATRYAQKVAVGSHCEVQVSITAAGYALNWPNEADCGSAPANFPNAVPHPTGSGGFSGTTPNGVTVTGATIVFDASGTANATHTIKVGSRSFRVHQATGYSERL